MSAVVEIQIRGAPCAVEYTGDMPDDLWVWPPVVEPPLSEYEERAIKWIVIRDFERRRAEWISQKARLRVVVDMRRRGAL